jgi:neutral ceramidase
VQAFRFNNDLTIQALGGEVVVGYSLIVKKKFAKGNLLVAGYCNKVICYIPFRRVLDEDGYESNSSMISYVLPGFFKNNIEDKVSNAINLVYKSPCAKSSD